MKIMKIDTDCTDNGNGIRTVIYVSGCSHYCEDCRNILTQNFAHTPFLHFIPQTK